MNWGIKVLQTFALPLGHGTMLAVRGNPAGYIKLKEAACALSNLTNKERAVDEARTRDLHLGKVALYQLSYYRIKVPRGGIEPPTRRFSVYCSTD